MCEHKSFKLMRRNFGI